MPLNNISRMKGIVVLIVALLASCSTLDNDLKAAISYGEIIELNEYSKSVDKQLLVRLFSSPIYNESCFVEAHAVCQYQYYLSVSTFDEYPEFNIYRLTDVGEITDVKWLESTAIDSAIIEFNLNTYTDMAVGNNPDLDVDNRVLRVMLSAKSIEESSAALSTE
jgi:hypothetical protein